MTEQAAETLGALGGPSLPRLEPIRRRVPPGAGRRSIPRCLGDAAQGPAADRRLAQQAAGRLRSVAPGRPPPRVRPARRWAGGLPQSARVSRRRLHWDTMPSVGQARNPSSLQTSAHGARIVQRKTLDYPGNNRPARSIVPLQRRGPATTCPPGRPPRMPPTGAAIATQRPCRG